MLLDQQISWARARRVSKALKSVGYGTATIAFCYKTVKNLAKALEPFNPENERMVAERIMQAAGFKPRPMPLAQEKEKQDLHESQERRERDVQLAKAGDPSHW